MTKQMNINELTYEPGIHRASGISDAWVKNLAEKIEIGITLKPLLVQRVVRSDGSEQVLIVGGAHRWSAYKKHDSETVNVEWVSNDIWDYDKSVAELKEIAFRDNDTHGMPNSNKDAEALAREFAENFSMTQEEIGGRLNRPQRTVSDWVSDITNRKKADRNGRIVKLSRMGWTQQAIADSEGVVQQAIAEITKNSDFAKIGNFLAQGWTVEKIATHYSIDIPTTLAIIMDDMSDQERFSYLGWGLRTWDDWRFNECDNRFGLDWPGRIPAQLVAHALFYFTNPGDLVFDPMAGGGVVPDTCVAYGRKCLGYDASEKSPYTVMPHSWDLGAITWPTKKKADLVFFDPPYFSKMKDDYEKTTDGNATPISSMTRDDYLSFFYEFFKVAKMNIARNGRIAFLNADWRDFQGTAAIDENDKEAITILDYADLLKNAGWQVTHLVDTPMSSQRFNAGVVSAMQKKRILGVVRRTLIIAR